MDLTKYLDNIMTCPTLLTPVAYARNLLILYKDRARSAELMQRGLVGEAEQPTEREKLMLD
jgi:hypothetical protein